MFPSLGRSEIERVRRFGVVRSYAAGEALAKVGEVGHGLTIILAGKVDITRHDESGRREPIVTHGPGEFMGELAQLAGRPALVGAYALGAVEGLTGAEAGGRPPIAGDKSRRMPLPSAMSGRARSSGWQRVREGAQVVAALHAFLTATGRGRRGRAVGKIRSRRMSPAKRLRDMTRSAVAAKRLGRKRTLPSASGAIYDQDRLRDRRA